MTMPTEGRRRILHVWFPFLATDRIDRERRARGGRPDGKPLVTAQKRGGVLVVASVGRRARRMGLSPGITVAQARAQFPAVDVVEDDPDADAASLLGLARAAGRYTPFVGLDPPSGLFLDVTGCTHLFGGEAQMLQDLVARFTRWGFASRAAIAGHPGSSWGLARHGPGGVVEPGGDTRAMEPLPVAALRLPAQTVAALERLGLRTVGQLLAQPRGALVRRFGCDLARRIDQATGGESEPITPLSPVPPLVFERRFAEPVVHSEAILMALSSIAERLCHALETRGEGVRRVAVALYRADGAVHDTHIGTSDPLMDDRGILDLLKPRIELLSAGIESDSGIEIVRMAAEETSPRSPRQATLDGSERLRADLARLVDTLSVRLGAGAVQRLVAQDIHQPADADRPIPARDCLDPPHWPETPRGAAGDVPTRPLKVYEPPEPIVTLAGVPDGPPLRFVWRRVTHDVALAEGPERIAPSWWDARGDGLTCDYFRVEDTRGQRFWVFRKGLYGRETKEPRWFLHGIFA